MTEKKKLIIAIVAVLLIIIAVGGATFAYWSWQTNTTQRTSVSFTIKDASLSGDLMARIDGNGTSTVTNLVPTSSCTSSNALVKTVPIYYKNNTRIGAIVNVYTESSKGSFYDSNFDCIILFKL